MNIYQELAAANERASVLAIRLVSQLIMLGEHEDTLKATNAALLAALEGLVLDAVWDGTEPMRNAIVTMEKVEQARAAIAKAKEE